MEAQTQLEKTKSPLAPAYDLTGDLPNLAEARTVQIDLSSTYWTPEVEGENIRCFFQRVEDSIYEDQKTGEQINLPCVIVIAQKQNGEIQTLRNGSKRLVAAVQDALEEGRINEGMPLIITFLGKQKNKTNSYLSDRWSIKPLMLP
jgi:hypothetical protein